MRSIISNFSSAVLLSFHLSSKRTHAFIIQPPPTSSLLSISKNIYIYMTLNHRNTFSSSYSRKNTLLSSPLGGDVNENDDDNLEKWEKMFRDNNRLMPSDPNSYFILEEGIQNLATTAEEEEDDDDTTLRLKETPVTSEIRLITFDLDNTIWKTSNVINYANDALASFLESQNITYITTRTEVVMKELFQKYPWKYCPSLSKTTNTHDQNNLECGNSNNNGGRKQAPVLLTQLRKDAIQELLLNSKYRNFTNYTFDNTFKSHFFNDKEAKEFAEIAFQIWTDARHEAISSNYASSVLEILQTIKSSIRTSDGHSVIIGAITDGNSDPRMVNDLQPIFDFCINAESVGVSKPDSEIYYAAIRHVVTLPQLKSIFGDVTTSSVDDDFMLGTKEYYEMIYDRVGPWWVHIGDDFFKDIVAAKALNMRSIWSRELILNTTNEKERGLLKRNNSDDGIQTSLSDKDKKKRDVLDLQKDLTDNKVLTMVIGTEDFLSDSIRNDFADAIIDEFGDLYSILSTWHAEGLGVKQRTQTELITISKEVVSNKSQTSISNNRLDVDVATTNKDDKKFCVFCGMNLPVIAKFCSSCGEKQP